MKRIRAIRRRYNMPLLMGGFDKHHPERVGIRVRRRQSGEKTRHVRPRRVARTGGYADGADILPVDIIFTKKPLGQLRKRFDMVKQRV